MKFITVSEQNTRVDFPALKASGIDGVYICVSHNRFNDALFEQHYADAKAVGLKVGAYHLYGAPKKPPYTIASCKEGHVFGTSTKGKDFDLPFALMLDSYRQPLENPAIYNGINAFVQNFDKISRRKPIWKTAGLVICGDYAQLEAIADDSDLDVYPKWVRGERIFEGALYQPVDDFGEFIVYE